MQYPTYDELCKNVLFRMGEDRNIVNGKINYTGTVSGYLKTIPSLLQDAMSICATAGKYVVRSLEIVIRPVENDIQVEEELLLLGQEPREYTLEGAYGYYLEMAGPGVAKVYENEECVRVIENTSDAFTKYKGLLAGGRGKILFEQGYPYTVRHLAMYKTQFPSAEQVYEMSPWRRFSMDELAEDFYRLSENDVVAEGERITYQKTGDYYWESDKVLVLNNQKPMAYKLCYFAYPQHIHEDIAPDTVLYLDPEIYAIIPLYIEGKLRLINDEDYASTILNEFEQKRMEIMSNNMSTARRLTGRVWSEERGRLLW